MFIGIDARLPYYQRGGISQYILHLLPALAAVATSHTFVVGQMAKDSQSYLPTAEHWTRRNLYTPCHHRWERWALAAELAARPCDVWHSPDFIPPVAGARRRVITVHDLTFIHYPQFLTAESRRYYLDQIRWAVRVADHISADSEHTRQDLIHLLGVPPEKVTTIHLAANPLYQRPYTAAEIAATLAQHNLPTGFIMAVGTLEPRKNLALLCHAYAHLRHETGVDVPLVLVGKKGWLYDELFATMEALGLRHAVRHLDNVFDEQLAHLYHAAGLLATPSHYEGFGLPALEAMHCGCPVLVSGRGSLPEIVGSAGRILPADDAPAWAEAMHQTLTDTTLRQRMAADGRARATHFSWPTTAAQTMAVYEAVSRKP